MLGMGDVLCGTLTVPEDTRMVPPRGCICSRDQQHDRAGWAWHPTLPLPVHLEGHTVLSPSLQLVGLGLSASEADGSLTPCAWL